MVNSRSKNRQMEDVKKGLLCMLIGGNINYGQEKGMPSLRGEINILLCGDPGLSKSQVKPEDIGSY